MFCDFPPGPSTTVTESAKPLQSEEAARPDILAVKQRLEGLEKDGNPNMTG